MNQIYYGQNKEDEILSAYFPNIIKGKYIDIGCAGIDLSNTYFFYKQGWRGIIIDPGLEYREGFKDTRPEDIFLPIAITDYEGEIEMCDAATVGSWLGDKYKYEELLDKKLYMVKCTTISSLLDWYPEYRIIDLLNIDIETNEDKVLSKCDFNIFKPSVICIEYKCRETDMREKWEHFLTPYYKLAELIKTTSNAIYTRR